MPLAQYANALRLVGRLLDSEGARAAEITEDDDSITVSWLTSAGSRQTHSYRKGREVEKLTSEARRMRGDDSHETHLEPLLRTLGQDLDREGMRITRITERRGFQVSGVVNGRLVDHWYSADELEQKNIARQTPRPVKAAARHLPNWRFWDHRTAGTATRV